MDASAAWLVVGVVLVALAVAALVTGLAARRRGGRARGPAAAPVDDLADFLEHPPGTRPEAAPPAGWAVLAAPVPAGPVDDRGRGRLLLAALCVAALAVVGTVAAIAGSAGSAGETPTARATGTPPAPATSTASAPPEPLVADLAVGGLVLEPRAVGVTVAYPELRLALDAGSPRLELRLPTYNCLTDRAPADPVAAGCAATPVEHAVVEGHDLRVERDGAGWVARGEAATELRPGGSGPEPTGRVYPLELTVVPEGDPDGDGVRPVTGELRLGAGSAPVLSGRSRVSPAG